MSPSFSPTNTKFMAPQIAKTACVMDSSSPLGTAIVNRLLGLGYSVHAASFSRGDSLNSAWRESKRVRGFMADPLDYHSIAAAIRGCSGLFYTCDNESAYDVSYAADRKRIKCGHPTVCMILNVFSQNP